MFRLFVRGSFFTNLLCLVAGLAYGQPSMSTGTRSAVAVPTIELCYLKAEQMPHLPNGKGNAASIEAAVRSQLHYKHPTGQPPFAATDVAVLCFTISPNGQVKEARVLSKLGPGFDRALLAAVAQLPRFVPGKQEGQSVAVRYTLVVGATGPYAGNSTSERGGLTLPPTWPEIEQYPSAPPRLPGNVGVRTALAQRLVYPPAGAKSRFGSAPLVVLAFTVDTHGHPTDLLIENSGGLAYDRAAVAAVAALPAFEPYQGLHGPAATRLQVQVDFPPRPAGYRPVISNQLPADPPIDSPAIVEAQQVEVWPGTNFGGRYYLNDFVQQLAVMPAEVGAGTVDGLVLVQGIVGLSGRVYGLQIRQSLTPACDSAALTAVRRIPLLTPGQYRGQTVAVRLTFVLHFWGPTHVYTPGTVPHPAAFAGPPDLETYIRANLRVPDSLRRAPQPRSVDVLAVIGRDGRIQNATITRSFRPLVDQEALRLVREMPAWQPARNAQNQPVISQVPFTFSFPPPSATATPPTPIAPPSTIAPVAPAVVATEPVYTYVEQMPELPSGGGLAAIKAALQQRFCYPTEAVREQTRGVISITFVVGADGKPGAVSVTKGLSAATDRAALAAVRALPRFVPGKQNDRVVAVSYTLSIDVAPPTKR
jgi:TonB family protein